MVESVLCLFKEAWLVTFCERMNNDNNYYGRLF